VSTHPAVSELIDTNSKPVASTCASRFGEIGLAEAGLAEEQHGQELDGLVSGHGKRQMLAQIVDDAVEVRRGVVEVVDGGDGRRLDDVARPAELAHPVIPARQAFVALGGAVPLVPGRRRRPSRSAAGPRSG
jgi:hypothetical protein